MYLCVLLCIIICIIYILGWENNTPRELSDLLCHTIVNCMLIWLPQLFVASVLLEPELALTPMPSPAHHSYGAMASSQGSSHNVVEEEEGGEDHAQTHETELQDPPDPYCASPLMDSPVDYQ